MNDRHEPLGDILMRIAEELREAAKDTDRLHRLVDSVEWRSVQEKDELIRSAQSIDAIEQRLSGLSDFVSALAELASERWLLQSQSASQKVKLAALAARLAGRPLPGASQPAGESEFF